MRVVRPRVVDLSVVACLSTRLRARLFVFVVQIVGILLGSRARSKAAEQA